MASCLDVAQYILEKNGELTTLKLQKLVYYCQAWSLVWDEAPLFDDRLEAWANGPVAPALFAAHRGQFSVSHIPGGDSSRLSQVQKETVNAVLATYGDKPAQWLVELSHLEEPWRTARGDCPPGASCTAVISHEIIADYYSRISAEKNAS